jgi:hypothetical protein
VPSKVSETVCVCETQLSNVVILAWRAKHVCCALWTCEITKRALLREYLKDNFNNILQVKSFIRAVVLFGVYLVLWLFRNMWVFVCVGFVMCGVCNVWVCVCVGFVTFGCLSVWVL